jgi:hypothetical protein
MCESFWLDNFQFLQTFNFDSVARKVQEAIGVSNQLTLLLKFLFFSYSARAQKCRPFVWPA